MRGTRSASVLRGHADKEPVVKEKKRGLFGGLLKRRGSKTDVRDQRRSPPAYSLKALELTLCFCRLGLGFRQRLWPAFARPIRQLDFARQAASPRRRIRSLLFRLLPQRQDVEEDATADHPDRRLCDRQLAQHAHPSSASRLHERPRDRARHEPRLDGGHHLVCAIDVRRRSTDFVSRARIRRERLEQRVGDRLGPIRLCVARFVRLERAEAVSRAIAQRRRASRSSPRPSIGRRVLELRGRDDCRGTKICGQGCDVDGYCAAAVCSGSPGRRACPSWNGFADEQPAQRHGRDSDTYSGWRSQLGLDCQGSPSRPATVGHGPNSRRRGRRCWVRRGMDSAGLVGRQSRSWRVARPRFERGRGRRGRDGGHGRDGGERAWRESEDWDGAGGEGGRARWVGDSQAVREYGDGGPQKWEAGDWWQSVGHAERATRDGGRGGEEGEPETGVSF